jgi:hypothetical protein
MAFTIITKRPLKNVSQKIWDAISVMEQRFGAQLTHDSGHDKKSNGKATTWIFNFPNFDQAQIAVPMNKDKFSLLMRAKTLDGRALCELVGNLAKVGKTYVNSDKGVASSVLGPRAPFLNPSSRNPLLRVIPTHDSVEGLLALYLAQPIYDSGSNSPFNTAPHENLLSEQSDMGEVIGNTIGTKRSRHAVTADELQHQLDRKAETGRAGELIAVLDELKRLGECECLEPVKYVERVALSDVGRGYDIASTWPGEERCIEVKSTTCAGSDFFITENECQVLAELGDKAWIYRVVVGSDGSGEVVLRLKNPMSAISSVHRTPVIWRVDGEALEGVDATDVELDVPSLVSALG